LSFSGPLRLICFVHEVQVTIPLPNPGSGPGVIETLGVEELHLGQSNGNEDAEPVMLRVWSPPGVSPFFTQFLDNLVTSGDDDDRVLFAGWLLNDVWEPGRPQGQRLLPEQQFSWVELLSRPELYELLGISDARARELLFTGDDAVPELEAAALAHGDATDNLAALVAESFTSMTKPVRATDTDFLAIMQVVVEEYEGWKAESGKPAPAGGAGPANTFYRHTMQRRIRRGVRGAGIKPAAFNAALRKAASLHARVQADANALLLKGLQQLDAQDRPSRNEAALYQRLHTKTIAVGGGLHERPLGWNPIFRSLLRGVSERSKERLVYVYCTVGVRYPPDWKDEMHCLVAAYLRLYGDFLRLVRQGGRQKKGSSAARQLGHTVRWDARADDLGGSESLGVAKLEQALHEAATELAIPAEKLQAVFHDVSELRRAVQSMGLFTNPERLGAIHDGILQVQDALVGVVVGSALRRAKLARLYFRAYVELGGRRGAHKEIAKKFRVARSTVSESLALAVGKSMAFVENAPACKGLLTSRLREVGLGKHLPSGVG